jgi:hypothetical protein
LQDDKEVQNALDHYPRSLGSMNALPSRDTQPHTHYMPGILSIGTVDTAQAAAEGYQRELTRQQARILSDADRDPKQALSVAMDLPLSRGSEPDYSPRASTLISLARIVATSNPAVSKAALEQVRTIAAKMSPRTQASILRLVPEIYLRLGDDEGARDSLDELIKIAGKLYSIDSDADDPNQAFKAMWPSSNLWRDCVAFAAKLAPARAEEIIRDIPDPEIRAFERITLANSLLGADIPSLSIIEKHKTGIVASMGL